MNDLGRALASVPAFRGLDERAIATIARRCSLREHEPEGVVMFQDEPCAGLGLVRSGQVRVLRSSVEGREQVLRIVGAGRSFNDTAAIDGGPNAATVIANVASSVALLPREALLELLDAHPPIARNMLELGARRERAMIEMVEDAALHSILGRVARLLLRCAEGDQQLIEGVPDACAHITQQEIAALTGSVREVAQRALKRLEQEGAIRMRRAGVSILDRELLRSHSTQ